MLQEPARLSFLNEFRWSHFVLHKKDPNSVLTIVAQNSSCGELQTPHLPRPVITDE